MKISPHAIIDPKAQIGPDVEIGPFCIVGPDVVLGAGCRLMNNVTLTGHTTIGRNNVFFPNSVIGAAPQDKKYHGEPTKLVIGDGNMFREAVTVHTGTEVGGGITRVGNDNLLMVNAHLGHDAVLGSNCILANNCMIAGHVVISDFVAMMGGVGIHHFVTVGEFAFLGGYARIHHDVPPFVKIDGADSIRGLNVVGMRRAGFGEQDIEALESAYRRLFSREKPLALAMAEFDHQNGINRHVKRLLDFMRQRDLGKHGRFRENARIR
jgi:UDP-N-acetylglucosamine acyltransferase